MVAETASVSFADMTSTDKGRRQFAKWVIEWYVTGDRGYRDRLASITYPPEMCAVPVNVIYRGVEAREEVALKLAKGKTIKLNNRKSSSWAPTKKAAHDASPATDELSLVVAKKVKRADVAMYSPLLFSKNRWLIKACEALGDPRIRSLHNVRAGTEKEILIRNTPYWITVAPADVVYAKIDGMGLKQYLKYKEGE